MKNFVALVLSLIVLIALGSCSKSCGKDEISSSSLLRIGTNATFPPFETNKDGKLIGLDIDIGRALADKLGLKAEFKEFDFDALILALKQGKIDIILSALSITPSRLEEIDMVPYQGKPITEIAFLFWDAIPSGIEDLSQLKTFVNNSPMSISVQAGHYLEDFLRDENIKVKPLAGPPEQIVDIKYKKSLAAALDIVNAKTLSIQHPQLKLLLLPLPPEKWDLGYGVGIRKNNVEMVKKISAAIEELKSDGSIAAIENIWIKDN